MTLALYRLTAAPLMVFFLILLSPFHRKLRRILKLKLQKRFSPGFSRKPIWIHAASGEFEYAKAVIRECKKRDPGQPILVTYSSDTYVKAIEGFPGVDFSLPLPIDLPGPCAAFLKKYNPRCLLIARTDLWPEILAQTQKRNIPIVLFSYTQKPLRGLARHLRRWLLGYASEIRCVSEEDAKNLRELGVAGAVSVDGDTRYDQVRYRLDHPKELPFKLKPSRTALVAGSTWWEDEEVLISALAPFLQARRLQLILVPHEPTPSHLTKVESLIRQSGLMCSRYSSGQGWAEEEVLLVDQVGVLAELYQWGELAFVGGSFKGSVHSVMEPLGAGLLTLVGPHHQNNREATEFAQISVGSLHAVQVCQDANQVGQVVELALAGDTSIRRGEILKMFNSRLGASPRLSEQIFDHKSARLGGDDPRTSLHN